LYSTTLTHAQQHEVIIGNNVTFTSEKVIQVQNDLKKIGYTYLPFTPGAFGVNAALVFQAFNRHFCPEIFVDESVDWWGTTAYNDSNMYWYGISDERLQKLLSFK
ncbi:hypothetical protein OESDEN_19645, partial [Oesophagostomum dentatum]